MATTNAQLVDWLDDLTVRFLLNLPASELSSVPRLCFQVEEAQWFYEDFIRPAAAAAGNPLPSLPLRQFCMLLFQHCPLLSGFSGSQHIAAYEEFLAYKVRVPVRGAIMMDETMEKLVLVKGWKKGASWSFPRGKINKDEKDLDCAIREVWEETGFDIRQAGLVPIQDADVKYIDITMREQHMRLFVFRGVSEQTHFEPKTRKEISKISWYNVRDLPGFKKQSKGVDSAAQANKFYMVAPFLGPLKKWIGQQRKKDAEAQSLPQPVTEDEGLMTEDYSTLPQTVDRSDELRGLLGVGGVSPMPQHAKQSAPPMSHTPDLLAMIQGRSGPHTPFEQVQAAVPPQPISPEPQHMRHPPQGYQGMPPQFPYSPHRGQPSYQQPLPTPQIFGHHAQPNFPGPHQHQHAPAMPMDPRLQHERYGGFQGQQGPPHHMQQWSQPPPSELMAQGSQAAIGSGPHVPSAERLPMPRLSNHSMNLLNSFKGGNKTATSSQRQETHAPRQTSLHQTALLDLFKKPIIPTKPVELPHSPEPVSPTLTDVTVKPQKPERKATMNEITRTLPKPKTKPAAADSAFGLPANVPLGPKAMQTKTQTVGNQDPAATMQPSKSRMEASPTTTDAPVAPKTILQRHAASSAAQLQPQSPNVKQDTIQNRGHASPGRENGHPAPPFTILPRPGSARASPSPLASGGESFLPQVLKRSEPEVSAPLPTNGDGNSDKREHLLSLFNQGGKAAPKKPDVPAKAPETHQNNLLNLFNGPPQAARTQEPPKAPAILPERHASYQGGTKKAQNPALLGLFTQSTADSNMSQDNIATPISPFALGTPVTKRVTSPTQMLPIGHSRPGPSRQGSEAVPADRSRLNSVASSVSNVGSGRATPTEAKGFLLDYLNGVVQKEGTRGRR